MAEAAAAARTLLKSRNLDQFGARHRRDYQLRDSLAGLGHHRILTKVDQYYPDLAAVIRVDSSRRIDQRQSLAQRAPAARPHLALEACGNVDRETGRDRRTFARCEPHRRVEI